MSEPITTWYMKQNDLKPFIAGTLKYEDGTIADLTGCTVKFLMRHKKSDLTAKIDAAAEVVGDPTLGQVMYRWQTDDTDTNGRWQAEWEVRDGDDKPETFPNGDGEYLTVIITDDIA